MEKRKVASIKVDEDVLREAKELGLNVSKIAENSLKEAIRRLKGIDYTPNLKNPDSQVPGSSTLKNNGGPGGI